MTNDDLEAIKGWVATWVEHELRLEGHILYRMILSTGAGFPLDPEGENDDDIALPEDFNPIELLKMHGPDAEGVLCAIAAHYVAPHCKNMPRELAYYISRVLLARFHEPPRRKRGGTKYKNLARDHLIYLLVGKLERLGLNRSRNREQKDRDCAYSLAAKILTDAGITTTERAVEETYRKFV